MQKVSDDPFFRDFFARIPGDAAASFTDAQLDAVKLAYGARSRSSHGVDIRLSIPLIRRRFYMVLLAGAEHRRTERLALERALRSLWTFANAAAIVTVLVMLMLALVTGLYLGKRAAGIDVFPGIDVLPDQRIERVLGID